MDNTQEQHTRTALCQLMAGVYRRGWCEGTGGNFSVVLQSRPLQLLMAPSGVHKGEVAPEALIVVNAQGAVLRGTGRASAETLLHLAIIEQTGAGAVLHSHSQAGTLLSQRLGQEQAAELLLQGLEMLKGLEGIKTHQATIALPVLPNDQNLERLSAAARPLLSQAPHGLLIAGHGLYAWGADLDMARRHLEILEFLLEQRWRQLVLEPDELKPVRLDGVKQVLLDIEGTTCPIRFVGDVLFPYAAQHLGSYIKHHEADSELQLLLEEVDQTWKTDADAAAAGLPWTQQGSVLDYLQWLISVDRKLTPLKDLQGLIWAEGYGSGELKAPLFADVAPALRRWQQQGLGLAVYSSGSVPAQQLLYHHSDAGDLRPLFNGWFDTRIGIKQEAASFRAIADQLLCDPRRILFISDAVTELVAARDAGLQVLLCERPGNPEVGDAGFAKIKDFSCLQLRS